MAGWVAAFVDISLAENDKLFWDADLSYFGILSITGILSVRSGFLGLLFKFIYIFL